MINKFKKIINNKFSRFFKFIFFLRYLLAIFFVSVVLFLFIPQFFDYKKKEKNLVSFLSKYYGLEIQELNNIKFKPMPTPHLEIENLIIKVKSNNKFLNTKKLIIYPRILSIYNFNNFLARKVKLETSNIQTNLPNLKTLIKNILSLENKVSFQDLNIEIKEENKHIMDLKKINFFNYGYKKNIIDGEIFNQKFRIKLKDDFNNIEFDLLNTGVSFFIKISNYYQSSKIIGDLKGKVLKSNFKLDFIYDKNSLKFDNLYFRDKNLSFKSEGNIIFDPFFKVNLNSEIENINTFLLKDLNIINILSSKDLIKKLNGQVNINFKSKKFKKNLIDNLKINTELVFGRLNFSKKLSIFKSEISCSGEINLLDDFPVILFDCFVDSLNKKILFKKMNIDKKIGNEIISLKVKGNLNILNNKINFNYIETNKSKFNKEDLKYYKINFEKILFDENFIKIFHLKKIKKFFEELI